MLRKKKIYFIIGGTLLFAIVFAGGITGGYFYFQSKQEKNIHPVRYSQSNGVYIEFLTEVYDKIQENYWNKMSDEELANLFKSGAEKLTEKPQTLEAENKDGVGKMLSKIIENMDENQKKEFSTKLAHLVLLNLKPFGRSGLYTAKDEENLKNRVQNINPETKEVETTVVAKLVRPDILHLYISKISPTTLDDLKKETEKFDNIQGLDTLILDLRKNIGGSLDVLLYLLGPFIGPNQYAFELFHQGDYEPFKTKIGWLPSLVRYKKVIVLIDEDTQSSGEVMAATLKKYNVGILVGTKTKGWGTIEKVYEIENQIDPNENYSIFLVNNLSLRDDNQPIEEKGVEPVININESNWEEQLFAYFHYNELTEAVKEIWNAPPNEF